MFIRFHVVLSCISQKANRLGLLLTNSGSGLMLHLACDFYLITYNLNKSHSSWLVRLNALRAWPTMHSGGRYVSLGGFKVFRWRRVPALTAAHFKPPVVMRLGGAVSFISACTLDSKPIRQ